MPGSLNKTRHGKMAEFSSYIMWNRKCARDLITFARVAQSVVFGLFTILWLVLHVWILVVIFGVMFGFSIKELYTHFTQNRHKIILYSLGEMFGMIRKTKPEYVESKIVKKVNEKWKK
jgi:uncharacterized membrane protein